MRRLILALAAALAALVLLAPAALAGSPHFIQSAFAISRDGNTLTVSGKEAGLGDEEQVHVVLTATAECVNPGGNKPKAENKTTATAAGDFPVQNGKADVMLSVTAVTSPSCTPPMTLVYSGVTLTDTTSGISYTFPGVY